MTLAQLAKQLDISPRRLEKESLRVFLLTKLGEIEAKRQGILSRYQVESAAHWDAKASQGWAKEGGYQGIKDYFHLDFLDEEKKQLIKALLSRE